MKKKSLVLALFVLLSVVLLSACGVTGSTQVLGVKFSTNKTVEYGIDGKQIKCFTLDKGEKFKIPFEIFPNTAAEHATIAFSHKADSSDNNKFNFINGVFEILTDDFPENGVVVTVTANGEFTDECLIKKANYLQGCSIKGADDIIYQNGTYVLSVLDKNDEPLDLSLYNFRVESSDESVIKVENEQDLVVKSTGKRGQAVITVSFISDCGTGNGEEIGSKKLSVLMNAAQTKIVLAGDVLIQNEIELNENSAKLPVEIVAVDSEGYEITGFTYIINVISGNSVDVDANTIQTKDVSANTTCVIEIVTNLLDESGLIVKLRLTINVKALTTA